MNKRIKILNTEIDAVQVEDVMKLLYEFLKNKNHFYYMNSANANNVINAVESKKYEGVMSNADLNLPDSVPFLWLGRWSGYRLLNRCGIQEIMEAVFNKSSGNIKYRHYFYGNTDKVLKKMKIQLLKKYPNLNIVGMYSPPFRNLSKEEDRNIINKINDANPDFLWVSLGCPKQEEWIYDHRSSLNPMVAGGAGAVFNFIAGETKRAPKLIQKLGLEWLYRLCLNPKKLSNRYLVKYPKFVYLFIKHHILGVDYK